MTGLVGGRLLVGGLGPLFKAALKNPDHVIHPLLPPPKAPGYNLRKRSHGLLPTTQSNLHKNFVYRMLFKDIY